MPEIHAWGRGGSESQGASYGHPQLRNEAAPHSLGGEWRGPCFPTWKRGHSWLHCQSLPSGGIIYFWQGIHSRGRLTQSVLLLGGWLGPPSVIGGFIAIAPGTPCLPYFYKLVCYQDVSFLGRLCLGIPGSLIECEPIFWIAVVLTNLHWPSNWVRMCYYMKTVTPLPITLLPE